MTRLQLVVPCYNEAARSNSGAFLQLVASSRDIFLLFVDDGSTDATRAVLAAIAAQGGGQISALTLPRNVGKAGAVQRGVLAAFERQPELVGYWDADLSTPLDAVQEFIHVLDSHPQVDIVMGARVKLLGRGLTPCKPALLWPCLRDGSLPGCGSAGVRHAMRRHDLSSERVGPTGIQRPFSIEMDLRLLLARRAFGTRAGYLTIVLNGFSDIGLFYATALWP